jgi:hypothetical protein
MPVVQNRLRSHGSRLPRPRRGGFEFEIIIQQIEFPAFFWYPENGVKISIKASTK